MPKMAVSARVARPELSAFLRDRRARVHPSDVGLPDGARRRTPGLRREEVAQLADVGASWYTWLEQGRDIQVSEAMLERLARALRLSPAERTHLFELAQGRPPARATLIRTTVSPALQRVIDAHRYPAVATTPRWDIIACNAPAVKLFGELIGHNSLKTMFASPGTRARRPTWEADARRLVARFRLEAARAANRADFDALAAELSASSDDFRKMWSAQDVSDAIEGAKVVSHLEVGTMEMDHVTLMHVEPDGHTIRITLYVPHPGVSTERADKLFANTKG